jgi:hypothetical protein
LAQKAFSKWLIPAAATSPEGLPPLPALAAPQGPAPALADEFAEIGRAVATAKTRLDAIPAADFGPLMRHLDLYGGLKRVATTEYRMAVATNASLKMYELIIQMRLLACSDGPLPLVRAFCNAELPGAFVAATNHYLKTMCPETDFEWLASSYAPEAAAASGDTTILGDQYGLYAHNRGRWLMGPPPNGLPEGEAPLSGDVTDPDVVAALADAVHARFAGPGPSGASLYTSDAGIDVSADYNAQEETTALINYGQVVCGLLALAPGGHLVTKQYTFVTSFSRSLIALVSALFDETYITKPLTSRPANSEVYLVGKGFRGLPPGLADALLDRLAGYRRGGAGPCALPPLLPPEAFAQTDAVLLRAARQIHGRQQVAFLEEAAALWGRFSGRLGALGRALARDARRAQEAWLSANPVRRIREEAQLAAGPQKAPEAE